MDENFDFREALDKVREMFSSDEGKKQLEGIMELFGNEPEEDQSKQSLPKDGGFDFDPVMLLKVQKILSAANSGEMNDRAKLLMSLKPFLRENRRDKVDKAVQLMNMSKVLSAFKEK